ncbi:MAG: redox-sensing transcriptional repressor Rex [Desulfotomaculum sp.]|nr:redox-sensing transcriptional repressor Rex [Desulfotomaculum sp.]
MKTLKIPEATVTRLSVYSRFLKQLDKKGVTTVSSGEIAEGVGVSPAQVRKDLAYFGEFGTRGVGYNVKDLIRYTVKILGLTEPWDVVLVGAGNMGSALVTYKEFRDRGFNIIAVFDNDLTKIGKTIADLEVMPLEKMEEVIRENNVRLGMIAVPAKAAQEVANMFVDNGIEGILNFAPITLNVPDHVEVRNVDLSVKLEILTFNLTMKEQMS